MEDESWTEVMSRRNRPSQPTYVPPHLRNTTPFPGRRLSARGGRARTRGATAPPHPPASFYDPLTQTRASRPFHTVNAFSFDSPQKTPKAAMDGGATRSYAVDGGGGGGVKFDAYEDIPVKASGEDIPPPVRTFAEIDMGKALNDNIRRCKYVKPTPVQRHAIPVAMAGRDLMACAQTGSGKTAAFCFPIISGLLRGNVLGKPRRGGARVAYPLALILSPTRELSCQIHEEVKKFSYQTGVKVVVAYGGAPISEQFRNLERGVDILVATPGRLVDMIERTRVSLSMVKYLVLDEADRMLDMGFEREIRKIVERMEMPPPGARQTMLFSATFPTEIQRLASDFLTRYIFLAIGRVGSSTDLIVQKVDLIQEKDKRSHLMNLLHEKRAQGMQGEHALTVVFVETKRGADALQLWLSKKGFSAIAIHGDKVQMEREQALRSFKTGSIPILVATDVAARGLDVPHVTHVINYDLPKDINDYVHRIGRTGRAGKTGLATAFFSDKNLPIAKALAELMQEANQEVPTWLTEYAATSSYGGSGRSHRGSTFGGHDFRTDADTSGNGFYKSQYADAISISQPHDASYGAQHAGAVDISQPYGAQYADAIAISQPYDAPNGSQYAGALAISQPDDAPSGAFSYANPLTSSFSATAAAEPFPAGTNGYGFDHGSIVASGWD
ncbi:hypothetical protein RJ640_018107 [Escallonia rubra]|uniref:RNA helicase n=1 Tax=Escallonia rubra TaxID=112253 RepID=A0AA88QQQ8_9ASTE|nr:hypothetical protein RJ640_018107 [Escallonia rubra]